ncbi:hypothetical protein KM043_004047 [Ampulex compressa]|nr:hypothetical protein KM043_004047 [Ampulex compressa]
MAGAARGSKECLQFCIQGSIVNPGEWGDEYVRQLEAEIVDEWTDAPLHEEPRIGHAGLDSARANLALSFVSGFVHAGFGKNKLTANTEDRWVYKGRIPLENVSPIAIASSLVNVGSASPEVSSAILQRSLELPD